ncbi:MAG: hypothetical protein WCA19_08035 [Candidatus Acidiferrales bacterium]
MTPLVLAMLCLGRGVGVASNMARGASGGLLPAQAVSPSPAVPSSERGRNGMVDVREFGVAGDGRSNDTAAMAGVLRAVGAAPARLVFPAGAPTVLSTISFPANVTLDFSAGGSLRPATGETIKILGAIVGSSQQIFYNALPGQGTIDFTGGYALRVIYPEWWGASPGASATTNTPALQAAEYAAFGTNRSSPSGLSKYNRELQLCGMYDLNDELKFYHVIGFRITGCGGKFASGLRQTAANKRILDGQNIAYGVFEQLRFETSAPQKVPLIDLDNDHSHGADLSPQNITFRDVTFVGNGVGQIGVLIAKHGGDAQGDNIRCEFCYASGFTEAAWQIGGNGTGVNTGRFYAQNAIKIQFIGGDIQTSPRYGIASYGGSYSVLGTTVENNVGGNTTQTGVDFYCEAPQGTPCLLDTVRSESLRLAAGGPWTIRDSSASVNWAQTFDSVAGKSEPLHQLITGTWVGGDGKYYQVTVSGRFGGLPLTAATGGTPTTLVVLGASYAINEFTGYKASIVQGKDVGCYGLVTSNTATTITFSAGLVSDYNSMSGISCSSSPDSTSKFVVEPNWGTQTFSGSATFALFDFNVIDGPFNNGTIGSNFEISNLSVVGGKINATGDFSDIVVSRTDWMPSGISLLESGIVPYAFKNVVVARVGRNSQFADVPWNFPRNGITGYKDYTQFQIGTMPVCWAAGSTGGGAATLDACIKPDGSSGAKSGRLQIVNSSSGTAQITNFNADGSATFPASITFGSVTFAHLPSSPTNGQRIYCTDCTVKTPPSCTNVTTAAACACTSGGTGAEAKRINGAWLCN